MNPEPHRRSGVTLAEILLAGLILLAFLQAAIPLLTQARDDARTHECVRNLRAIQKAKVDWARDHHEVDGAEPTDRDLFGPGRYRRTSRSVPAGGPTTCTLSVRSLVHSGAEPGSGPVSPPFGELKPA